LGKDVANSIACLKETERDRLFQTSTSSPKQSKSCQLDEEEGRDMDSDLGLDHNAIQHLVGDIVDDILGTEGTTWSDFKPVSRKCKSGSSKKSQGKNKKKVNIQNRNSQ
jgi:hypothetical protein